jgi:hypothetical protein
VNAESDFLSGLIIDKYEDVLVVQISSLGMDQRKAIILAALQTIFSPRAIVERSEVASRKFEGLAEANGVLAGLLGGPVPVRLNGLHFEADVLGGHKTGLYLDQQVNCERVAELANGGQVLDGRIRRGEGELMHAIIWFCDLRGSTRLAAEMPRGDYITMLNDSFECTAGAIIEAWDQAKSEGKGVVVVNGLVDLKMLPA